MCGIGKLLRYAKLSIVIVIVLFNYHFYTGDAGDGSSTSFWKILSFLGFFWKGGSLLSLLW